MPAACRSRRVEAVLQHIEVETAQILRAVRLQPLEDGAISIARVGGKIVFPARFQLVMAANPCPCGLGFGKAAACLCTPMAKRSYLGKLSGPASPFTPIEQK